jgi:thiamine transport system permease protein
MNVPRGLAGIAGAWILVFVAAAVVTPVAAVLSRAFAGGLGASVLFDPAVLEIARATALQALASTALSVLVGLPLGLACGSWISRYGGGSWIRALLGLPYGVPTVVIGLAGVAWLGRSGVLARAGLGLDILYTFSAVILAHVVLNAPWIALRVADARAQVPYEQLSAARTLGAGALARARFVVWPHVGRVLAAASAQVFGLCATSFALILLLGGGPPVDTLETAIYSRVRSGAPDFAGAAAAGAWELAITLVPWIAVALWQVRRVPGAGAVEGRPAVRPASGGPVLGRAALLVACAVWTAPYLLVFDGAFWERATSAGFLARLAEPAAISLALAAGAAALALLTAAAGIVLGSAMPGLRAPVAVALSAPSGISVLVIGLGVWLAYGRWIDPFEGSLPAMTGILGALYVPVAFRTFWGLAHGTQRAALEAARTLGASPWRAFWAIEWPRWRPGVVGAGAVVGGAAAGEVAAVSLFYSEGLVPLPLLVTRWMGQYRFEDAQAVAAILLLLSAGTIAAVTASGERRA